MSSCLIASVGLGLLDSSNPSASASCGAEITGTNHRTSLNSIQSPPPHLGTWSQNSCAAVSSPTYFMVMSLPEKKNASISCLSLGATQLPNLFLHKMQEVSPDFTLWMLPAFILYKFSPQPLITVLLTFLL